MRPSGYIGNNQYYRGCLFAIRVMGRANVGRYPLPPKSSTGRRVGPIRNESLSDLVSIRVFIMPTTVKACLGQRWSKSSGAQSMMAYASAAASKFERVIEGASPGLGNDTLENTEFTASSMRCLCVMLWRECTMRRSAALATGHPIRGVGAENMETDRFLVAANRRPCFLLAQRPLHFADLIA